VINILAKLVSVRGATRILRCDDGPEFVSRKILEWIVEPDMEVAHIDPGKSWQNGADESFNGRLRDECLNMEWFRNRTEARVIIEPWRRHYNQFRPHSSLGYRTPTEFRQHHDSLQPGAALSSN
jgi:putative transposase